MSDITIIYLAQVAYIYFYFVELQMPEGIRKMNIEDRRRYMKIIKTGTEIRHYVRIQVIGENGVGKTCLVRRLLKENIDDVTSTDGVDIAVTKCKIRLHDGVWIFGQGMGEF